MAKIVVVIEEQKIMEKSLAITFVQTVVEKVHW